MFVSFIFFPLILFFFQSLDPDIRGRVIDSLSPPMNEMDSSQSESSQTARKREKKDKIFQDYSDAILAFKYMRINTDTKSLDLDKWYKTFCAGLRLRKSKSLKDRFNQAINELELLGFIGYGTHKTKKVQRLIRVDQRKI